MQKSAVLVDFLELFLESINYPLIILCTLIYQEREREYSAAKKLVLG